MALLGKAAMVLSFDVAPEAIVEHDNWHSHEHFQERMSIRGFQRGSRWLALSGEPRYFVLYEVADIDTLASPAYLERYRSTLAVAPNITVGESPPDGDDFIRLLRSASVLLLPVNFDRQSADLIRYSLPTKVPAYLASGTPILAYGPRRMAQIEYARDERWAHIVNERSVTVLAMPWSFSSRTTRCGPN